MDLMRASTNPSNQANVVITLSMLQIIMIIGVFALTAFAGVKKHHNNEIARQQQQQQTVIMATETTSSSAATTTITTSPTYIVPASNPNSIVASEPASYRNAQ